MLSAWKDGTPLHKSRGWYCVPPPSNRPAARTDALPQGAAKRLQEAEEQLDQVLEAALGDDFDALDDFDAMEEAVPPPRPAGARWGCAGLGVPAVFPVHRLPWALWQRVTAAAVCRSTAEVPCL